MPDDREDEDLYAAVPEEPETDDDLFEGEPDETPDGTSGETRAEEPPGFIPDTENRKEQPPDEPAVMDETAEQEPEKEEELPPSEEGAEDTVSDSDGEEKPKWLSGEWIDRKFNGFVDRAVVQVPAFFRLTGIRIARGHLGWHIWLILVSIRNAVSHLLGHFRSEDDMDLFLDDTAEHLGDRFSALKSILSRWTEWLIAIDMAGIRLRFVLMLFFVALSACGCALIGTWELATLAFLFVVSWLSTAFDLSYKPVIGRIRQVYIAARLLSALSMLFPSMMYYVHYRNRGVANNMMLQGMLIFMLLTHLVLFTVMILPNRQQSLFLRVLSGILGIIPALLVANVVSYSATLLGMGFGGMAGGFMRIMGSVMLFVTDRIESLNSLGSLRFAFSELLLFFCYLMGCILLLTAAWVFRV